MKTPRLAAKRRKNTAHGVSRGNPIGKMAVAPKGRKNSSHASTSLFLCIALLLISTAAAQEKNALPQPEPGNVTLTLDEYNRL
jgi:hypothetical protein